jgi:hypothetical protein
MFKVETVSGTIKWVGCARINGDDHFSLVLEEDPCQIYTCNKNPRLAIAREGQCVRMTFESNPSNSAVKTIQAFDLIPQPA